MATSGIDRTIKIWDLRTFKQLSKYKVSSGANSLSFSQTGILAAASTDCVEVSGPEVQFTGPEYSLLDRGTVYWTEVQFTGPRYRLLDRSIVYWTEVQFTGPGYSLLGRGTVHWTRV